MEALKRARRPVRRKFENTIRELEKLLKQDPLNIDDINVKFESFNEVFESLQSHDAKIVEQMTIDGVTEAEEDKEWDDIGELNERGKSMRLLKGKMAASKVEDKTRTRLDLLVSFVEREVQIRRRVDLTRTFANQQKVETTERKLLPKERKFEDKRRTNVPTLSSFHNSETRGCVFCNNTNHGAANCFRAKSMSYDEKMNILKEKRLCFRCMGPHRANQCRAHVQCGNCQRRHATVLCREHVTEERKGRSSARYGGFIQPNNNKRKFFSPTPLETSASTFKRPAIGGETQLPSNVTSSNANIECSSEVALQTLLVKVMYGRESKVVRAFIDSGSQRSYILKSTVKDLSMRPVGVEKVVHSLFGGKQTSTVTHNKYELELSSLQSDFVKMFVIRDSDKIYGKLPTISTKYPEIVTELLSKNVTLTDCDVEKKDVELLIGADIYATIVTGKIEKLKRGAAAVHTDLGWTLLGNVADYERDDMASLCLSMSVHDADIAKLWELDVIGVEDPSQEKSVKKRLEMELEKFVENISRDDDGRYVVKLPWKNNLSLLPSKRPVAFKRLETASKKLVEKKLFAAYHTIFADWEKEGLIERVSIESDSDVIHYLPHRPIIKESKTTPVRPVFDASCRVGKAPSLNDCLFTGENKVKAIPELILRFREKRIAFVSDIRKAFQMIGVKVEDRDAMRFLWWTDESMKKLIEYRHVRVMFGATCSPFILEAVLNFHLTNLPEDEREIGEKLLTALYVDNCVSSEDSVEDYQLFRKQATELLKNAKMDLRMWFSNVDEFDDPTTHSVSVLGLQWYRIKDELFVPVKKVTVPVKITKRAVLSVVQKIFDPIGFTSPALLPMKLFLQRAWIHKLKWDDDLPEVERRAFVKWCDEVSELEAIRLPRLSTAGVSNKNNWSLHTFTDASKDAYAAVVFLRVERCLIGKRLVESVKKVKEYFWSDSTTAIAWIRQDPELWGTFVSNRTKEIRDGAAADKWRHVPGHNNPADLPSRGCFPSKLALSERWSGPAWLYEDEEKWPKSNEDINENEILSERRKSASVSLEMNTICLLESVREKFDFMKQVRVLGWVRRFLHNYFVKNHEMRRRGPLSKTELNKAELITVREMHRENFLKEKSLTLIELEHVMRNVEEVMRPLTYVRENPVDLEPVTPALFLYPLGNKDFPERGGTKSEKLRLRYNYVTTLKKELRGRILKEYLSILVNRKPKKVMRWLIIGELVLVGCDNLKRIEWPLGRVIEIVPGRDGVCRVARVRTLRGEIMRSVQRLFPLEMDCESGIEKHIREKELRTRSGRKVQIPLRYK